MNNYQDSIIRDISRLVKIPSVYQESDSYLFGEAIDHCLDEALSIMKDLGYSTFKAEDGAYGYAEIGEGETFAVLAHLDVVNARVEDGWEHDPFDPIIKDGYLCGRGVQDDKGPLMICAYALKALLD
ncbi:MAG: M20/M25/M40 family metallo-hydrolase, partial [Erysipelotrichaceae bacterium]